jgi:tight adherence protein B
MNAVASATVTALATVATGAALRFAVQASSRARVRDRLPTSSFGSAPRAPRLPAPAWLPDALDAAVIGVDPDFAWTVAVAAVTGATIAGAAMGGLALAVLGAGATAGGLAMVLVGRRDRAAMRVEQTLPAALEAVARSLRSGASLRAAVGEAAGAIDGRLAIELRRVAVDAERGVPLVVALDALAARRPLPGVRLAVAALGLGVETGGAQARAVDGVAATLRDRLAASAEARALSAQARASVWVIALAPIGFCAFAVVTDPRTATFYFRSPHGFAFLTAGIVLDALGALWMRRLSRITP